METRSEARRAIESVVKRLRMLQEADAALPRPAGNEDDLRAHIEIHRATASSLREKGNLPEASREEEAIEEDRRQLQAELVEVERINSERRDCIAVLTDIDLWVQVNREGVPLPGREPNINVDASLKMLEGHATRLLDRLDRATRGTKRG
jgi:uncharacterized protein (UPF0128 family)